MNPLEKELDYPLGDLVPGPAARIEVAPGVWWLRMPLPFALNHINLWLLRDSFDGEGWTVVDTGAATGDTHGLWQRLIADGLDGLPIRRVLCTHMHPDHLGMARTLTDRFDAPLWMTMGEYALARVLSAKLPGGDGESAAAHFKRNGAPEGPILEACRERGRGSFAALVPSMPTSFRRIRDHERIRIGERDWRVIVGAGHSPEHAALYCETDGLLISGDMVLPRISTNVSVFEIEPDSNPVEWYLESLGRFDDCRPDALVLPSHGLPFRNLHARLRQQRAHHRERLLEVMQACAQAPCSAADILPVMFKRELDPHQSTFALGEALGHLHALWYAGRLRRMPGDDGVIRFAA
jgi:glyoxylase-like metal-dependent hydrolase (beta-lactamase superfamily II)